MGKSLWSYFPSYKSMFRFVNSESSSQWNFLFENLKSSFSLFLSVCVWHRWVKNKKKARFDIVPLEFNIQLHKVVVPREWGRRLKGSKKELRWMWINWRKQRCSASDAHHARWYLHKLGKDSPRTAWDPSELVHTYVAYRISSSWERQDGRKVTVFNKKWEQNLRTLFWSC